MARAQMIIRGTLRNGERSTEADQALGNGRPVGRRLDDQGQMTWQEIADVISEATGERICAQTVINDHNRAMRKILNALLADPSAGPLYAHLGIDEDKLAEGLAEAEC